MLLVLRNMAQQSQDLRKVTHSELLEKPNNMAKLSYSQRKSLPKKDFALPSTRNKGKGGYPIPDKAHARNALARAAQFASPEEAAEIRAKVRAKFPGIGKKK